jgi:hypothetical protein
LPTNTLLVVALNLIHIITIKHEERNTKKIFYSQNRSYESQLQVFKHHTQSPPVIDATTKFQKNTLTFLSVAKAVNPPHAAIATKPIIPLK